MEVFLTSINNHFGELFFFVFNSFNKSLRSAFTNEVVEGSAVSVIEDLYVSLHPWWIFRLDLNVIVGNKVVADVEYCVGQEVSLGIDII